MKKRYFLSRVSALAGACALVAFTLGSAHAQAHQWANHDVQPRIHRLDQSGPPPIPLRQIAGLSTPTI